MDKIRLGKDTYQNVMDMLESPDEENIVVGFECIENADFKSNLVYILLLFKEADVASDYWEAHAPKTSEKIVNIFGKRLSHIPLTFKGIASQMVSYKVDQEDFQFYMNRYAEHLRKDFNTLLLKDLDVEYIESIEIIIKTKSI